MNIIIPAAIIGGISSIVVELFKLVPFLSRTDLRKQIVSFIVVLLVVSGYIFLSEGVEVGGFVGFLGFIIVSLTTSYGVFKTVIKGLKATLGFKN